MSTFDTLASNYDTDFTHTEIGAYLRGRVHQRLLHHWQAGDAVLELGCGTGEDAAILAANGVHITATDVSQQMLEITRKKLAKYPHTTIQELDIGNLPEDEFRQRQYRGVYTNFGVLNCIEDWQPLANWLAERIVPGGMAGFAVMSPYCLWEMGWHSAHLDFGTAFRRLRNDTRFQVNSSSVGIPIQYPTIRRLQRDFAPAFRPGYQQGIGLFLPPSDVFGVVSKRPRLMRWLTNLEERTTHRSWLAPFADHYWIEFQRISN